MNMGYDLKGDQNGCVSKKQFQIFVAWYRGTYGVILKPGFIALF